MKRKDERDEHGRFVLGNPGGPGRPPRPVEREYLTALLDVCTLDKWKQVCEKRLAMALDGDEKAIEWFERYLLGNWQRLSLTDLALRERMGVTAEAEFEFKAQKESTVTHYPGLMAMMDANDEPRDIKSPLLELAEFAVSLRKD